MTTVFVEGKIIKCKKSKSGKKWNTAFTIQSNDQIYEANTVKFFPIEYGDTFCGELNYNRLGGYVLSENYSISMGMDRNIIFNIIKFNSSFPWKTIYTIMDKMDKLSDNKIFTYLNRLSCYIGDKPLANHLANDDDIIKLREILGSSLGNILTMWHKKRNLRSLYLLGLKGSEITSTGLCSIDLYNQCVENPYKLYDLEEDVVNSIANKVGLDIDIKEIEKSKIARWVYNKANKQRFSCVNENSIRNNFNCYDDYKDELYEYGIKIDKRNVYPVKILEQENYIVQYVVNLMKKEKQVIEIDDTLISHLSDTQKEAVKLALSERMFLITGSAGTGKSTISKSIINNLELHKENYVGCSFTGMAVCRLKNLGVHNSHTIHSLLCNSSLIKDKITIIIDEATMIDMKLFYQLIRGFENNIDRIIMIGDV